MHASKPSSSVTHAHFAGDPAIPMTRAPCIRAIWPAIDPTLLAAAETQNVSPDCGLGTSTPPTYAVMPVLPMTPSTSIGATPAGTLVIGGNGFDCTTQYCCQPVRCMYAAPSGYSSGLFVSMTTPTPLERTGSPIATPGM